MKRIIVISTLILLVGLGIYFDLSVGTLPKQTKSEQNAETVTIPYQEVTVQAGYTVLSIVEHLHKQQVPATIEQIIYDFEQLNPNVHPDDIQIGETYLFPIYVDETEHE